MTKVGASAGTLLDQYTREFAGSRRRFEEAAQLFPGGVTHDLRHLEPFPIYVERARGAHKWDVDGHELIDYWSGHGAILLGHGHPAVVEAVTRQLDRSTHPGACHELEIEWGQWVKRLIPSAERMRFVSSGTEATMMALRLARLYTGKRKLLKFAGHFHGWSDFLMPGADPPHDHSAVPGVTDAVLDDIVIIPPNDPELVNDVLGRDPEIAAVILEPTGGHFGAVPVRGDFLRSLREITARHGRLLIFDEVISGFRVHPGGAQGHYGIVPDITTLAKILAGGLPGGCVAGRADVLAAIEWRPGKPKIRHPGTFNANPLSAAAGSTTLGILADGEPCRIANEMGRRLRGKLNDLFSKRDAPWIAYGEFSGFRLLASYRGPRPTSDDFVPYEGSLNHLDGVKDRSFLHRFRQAMLLAGVDLPGFWGLTTAAHTERDIDLTIDAMSQTLDWLDQPD
jgi:glutamate-1-semialdehyde 2,1-aminomutase